MDSHGILWATPVHPHLDFAYSPISTSRELLWTPPFYALDRWLILKLHLLWAPMGSYVLHQFTLSWTVPILSSPPPVNSYGLHLFMLRIAGLF